MGEVRRLFCLLHKVDHVVGRLATLPYRVRQAGARETVGKSFLFSGTDVKASDHENDQENAIAVGFADMG
jgi:hypothetical protein